MAAAASSTYNMHFDRKITNLIVADNNFHILFKSNENDPFRVTVMSLLEDGGLIDNNHFIHDMWQHNWDANEAGMNATIQHWIQHVANKKANNARRVNRIKKEQETRIKKEQETRIKNAAGPKKDGGSRKKRATRKRRATKSRKLRR